LEIIALLALAVWYYKNIYFFRDPKRVPPERQNIILSPADGNIIYIKEFKDGRVVSEKKGQKIKISEITKVPDFDGQGWIIGIYMKPTDVHFNYGPIGSRIKKIVYTGAKHNLPMVDVWEYINFVFLHRVVNLWSKKFHWQNERNTIFLENKDIRMAIVEIADKFVNKIDCYIKEGEWVAMGQKISFIKRGSQVDLVIYKKDLDFKVEVGEQVYGVRTILASYK
jgi:phosphatidylserine decarboxylase